MSREHRDTFEDFDLVRADLERRIDRDNEQREWEESDTRMIPKPPRRQKASAEAWKAIREHFSQETCWVCGGAWTDLHHIVPRSRSGDDVLGNLAPLCRDDHARVEARDPEARGRIRAALRSENFAYLSYRIGPETWGGWLDRNYAPLMEQAA